MVRLALSWSAIQLFAMLAKISPLVKAALGSLALLFSVAALNAPVENPWFDTTIIIIGLVIFNSIVKGEPEPDTITLIKEGKMTWAEFFYLWFYRSTHLASISATAYFIHPNKWNQISGKDREDVQ